MHPSHLLEPEALTVLDLWLAWRRDGMGGAGHLPFAGGMAQQPAALMRGLDAMSAAEARIRKLTKDRDGRR